MPASSTGFPKAKWGLGNSRAAREKRERGMMGTSVEREREVMGRNRRERGNVYHYKKVLKRYRRHWPERVGHVNRTFCFTGASYRAQLLKGRLVLNPGFFLFLQKHFFA